MLHLAGGPPFRDDRPLDLVRRKAAITEISRREKKENSEDSSRPDLEAQYGKQPDVLAHEIEERLTNALNHYFPDMNYSALVTVEQKDGYADDGTYQGNYGLNIAMVDENQAAIIPRQQIKVGKDGASFTPTFTSK